LLGPDIEKYKSFKLFSGIFKVKEMVLSAAANPAHPTGLLVEIAGLEVTVVDIFGGFLLVAVMTRKERVIARSIWLSWTIL
jgi:hypothetical protein